MTPDQLSELIRSAVEEIEIDLRGESTYGLRILAQNAAIEFFFLIKDFDRDQWIRDCGFNE